MKYVILLGLTLLVLSNYAQEKSSGVLFPTATMLDEIPSDIPKAGGVRSWPREKDLSNHMPVPGDQLATMACTGWAASYGLLTYLKKVEFDWSLLTRNNRINQDHVFSPSYIYNKIDKSSDCSGGAHIISILELLKEGCVPLSSYPVSCGKFTPNPSREKLAAQYSIMSINKLFDYYKDKGLIDTNKIKNAIDSGDPVLIGIYLDQAVWNDTYGDRTANESIYIWDRFTFDVKNGYHAMLVTGYDDKHHAFKILNSYGSKKFNSGYVWVSYEAFKDAVKEAYTVVNKPSSIRFSPIARGLPEPANTSTWPSALRSTYNWIKEGYYRNFGTFRVSCLNLDRRNGSVIIQISERSNAISNVNEINTFKISTSNNSKVFLYKNYEVRFELDKIAKAGKNPFKQAIYYTFQFKDLSSEN